MNRKSMETLILVVGTLVVAAALTLILTGESNPNTALYTNITFAVGFLFYIIYNMVSTSGLQGKIRDLNGQISGLKDELSKTRESLEKSEAENNRLQGELTKKEGEIKALESEVQDLKQTITELKSTAEEE